PASPTRWERPMNQASLAEETFGPASRLARFWQSFSSNRGALAGLGLLALVLLCALTAPWLAPHDPTEQFREALLTPPMWAEGGNPLYPLGTDDVGRCLLSRLLFGARLSLTIGALAVVLALLPGIALGLVAAFFPRGWGTAILRLMDVMLALPSLLLAIVIVAILGPGLMNAMLAVSVVVLPHYVRITRASVISEVSKDYVTAARVSGAGTLRLMFSEVLPNCAAPLIVQASLGVSTAILDAAALGFLGLGAQPPSPEWGTMLADAREFVLRAWWVVTFPGLAILVAVLAFNLMGDGLRDALDPKLKR
ncbi:ABC transporter permease subunit, partial [uncultured Ramlibacter sp.]|uniref:ABC transporter permease subunit n=1 Tax=uncultured Ramlibacter sp. TaxID=260755 RepID=UPI00345C17BC